MGSLIFLPIKVSFLWELDLAKDTFLSLSTTEFC